MADLLDELMRRAEAWRVSDSESGKVPPLLMAGQALQLNSLVYERAQDAAGDDSAASCEDIFETLVTLQGPSYDLPTRVVALAFMWELGAEFERVSTDTDFGPSWRDATYPSLREAQERWREDSVALLELRDSAGIPAETAALGWELGLSFAFHLPDRAQTLVTRLATVEAWPETDLADRLARMKFLFALDPALTFGQAATRTILWLGSCHAHRFSEFAEGYLLHAGLAPAEAAPLTPEARSHLYEAFAAWRGIEAALLAEPARCASLVALSRTCYELELCQEAARYYERVLSPGWRRHLDEDPKRAEALVRRVSEFCAKALLRAGDPGAAVAVLKEGAESPGAQFTDWATALAKMQVAAGQHADAAETLRKYADLTADSTLGDASLPGEPWQVSTILALAGVIGDQKAWLQRVMQAHPDKARLIDSLVARYWPRYGALCDRARERWISGHLTAHLLSLEGREADAQRLLASEMAISVELELAEQVFARYGAELKAHAGWKGELDGDGEEDGAELRAHFARGEPLTLGAMAHILDPKGAIGTARRNFLAWVAREHPDLPGALRPLRAVVGVRNDLAHGKDPRLTPRFSRRCQRVLEAIRAPERT